MLECVVNISEGRDTERLDEFACLAGAALLDLHADASHNRSVFTLAGPEAEAAAQELARVAVASLDIGSHDGVHPRLGVVDVVPFVPLGPDAMRPDGDLGEAIAARDRLRAGRRASSASPATSTARNALSPRSAATPSSISPPISDRSRRTPPRGRPASGRVPCSSPTTSGSPITTSAWRAASPARCAVPTLRTAGFAVGTGVQVSCNLVAPWKVGPADVYDRVAESARHRAGGTRRARPREGPPRNDPVRRWTTLDLGEDSTIEARLADRGFAITA